MTKEEILAMKVGYELNHLAYRDIFNGAKNKRWIKCYSNNISFTGEIVEQLFKKGLLKRFLSLVEEIAPDRTFPETVVKAALIAIHSGNNV